MYLICFGFFTKTLSRYFYKPIDSSPLVLGLHCGYIPVSSHSCCFQMYVRAGRPAFARPYVGVHRITSLMSSSLLLQQCPACLFCLTWIIFVMGGRWPCGVLPPGLVQYCSQHSCVCKMFEKQSEAFHTFLWHFFQV